MNQANNSYEIKRAMKIKKRVKISNEMDKMDDQNRQIITRAKTLRRERMKKRK